MTRGVLLFSFSGGFDYHSLAIKTSERIKKYLGLPVTVITDDHTPFANVDSIDSIVIIEDNEEQKKRFRNGTSKSEVYTWKNSNRFRCYELSPYDHTLILDVDYVINSDFLLKCFDLNTDFLIFKDCCDLSGWRKTNEFCYINEFSIPFYWATVVYFKKTKLNKIFFDLVSSIKENWEFYLMLYQIKTPMFRNDFAFSIAIHILNGYVSNSFTNTIPGKMYFTLDKDKLIDATDNSLTFLLEKEHDHGQYVPMKVNNLDVHVMNKFSLLDIL